LNAAAENDPEVRYACIASASPPPQALRFAQKVRSPYAALTAAMYSTLYQFTMKRPEMYPYATPTPAQQRVLSDGIVEEITERSNDGIVPTLSMLWGELIWSGEGDHLDVLGHFADDARPRRHIDWVTSGANFTRQRFAALADALARFLIG
jgi:hypothetical protein